ncbi:MAG: hypothetical protein A3D92_09910 [Bacteroidetes bacterium RIFCSPHIGHO2_02_FULL_44_7]|nr:MAG: hypothetical protein A3D92_09910 [Bacteroidetes bacterium RIFCSPHIGHO2_02_FULL_44_7]
MTPTAQGAFCASCSKEVIDFTTKNSEEIKAIFRARLGESLCGRIKQSQELALNREVDAWLSNRTERIRYASYLSLIAVFGMSLFSCNSPEAENFVHQWQRHSTEQTMDVRGNETVPEPVVEKIEHLPYVEKEVLYAAQALEEVLIKQQNEMVSYDAVTMGRMVYHEPVREFLIEQIEPQIEYDRNGLPIPTVFADKVFPNPTNGTAQYEIQLPTSGTFVIGLYALDGRHLRNLHEGELERGTEHFELDLSNELPGTFLVVTRSKNFSNTRKLLKL